MVAVQLVAEIANYRQCFSRGVKYTHETYNKINYDPRHVLPFLADMFGVDAEKFEPSLVRCRGGDAISICRRMGKVGLYGQDSIVGGHLAGVVHNHDGNAPDRRQRAGAFSVMPPQVRFD
jgi:hypothetical protein